MLEIMTIIYIISILFILERRTISALLYFIIMLITMSFYIKLDIDYAFLSFILIIVYSTAIIILFSFVIMLPEYSYPPYKGYRIKEYLNPIITSILLLLPFIIFTQLHIININNGISINMPSIIGNYLFNTELGHFYIILILLLLFLPIVGIYYIIKIRFNN